MKRVLTGTMRMPCQFLHRCMFTRSEYVPVLFNIKHYIQRFHVANKNYIRVCIQHVDKSKPF